MEPNGCDTRNCTSIDNSDDNPKIANSYLYPVLGLKYAGHRSYCNNLNYSSGYILSGSNRYNEDGNGLALEDYIGRSSYNMISDVTITTDNIDKINYTSDASIYKEKKKYASYKGEARQMIQYENTPEFYACLPLIKI